jgi:hypothetical protein
MDFPSLDPLPERVDAQAGQLSSFVERIKSGL